MAEQTTWPWPAASATGIGSMPGTDVRATCRLVFDETPDLPFLPELPARGPGADITGRAVALLVDMPAERSPRGWRLADRPGRDLSRAAGFWSQDLDTLEEVADGYAGPLKVQVCGPWTLAASLELDRSVNPVLADAGAVADLAASLAEGLAARVADLRKRVPGAALVVQVDEPSLPAVLAGRVPTASGLNFVAAAEPPVVTQRLAAVLAAAAAPTVVHCCGRASALPLLRAAGADAVSFDLGQLPDSATDDVAELAEGGCGLLFGALSAAGARRLESGPPLPARQTPERAVRLWRRTGLAPQRFAEQVVLTPACGLAGMSPAAARAALAHCREAARVAAEMSQEAS